MNTEEIDENERSRNETYDKYEKKIAREKFQKKIKEGSLISDKKVLIVPPGLRKRYKTFKYHYWVANGAPVLILGPTGVGKTLFYQIYKHLFLKENPDVTEDKIVRANCAHFGNQESDPNIARSELFGTDKNLRSTYKVKQGLIEKAEGGVLFLEEIGELPIAVQAMLLTFIEDNKFKKVGGTDEISSDCRIVAATNNEGALREDFKNRFFPFHLPPIYKRRDDVLYYLHEKYPDLVASLFKDEVLELLAYNWPGNVREIERVALLMFRNLMQRKNKLSKDVFEEKDFEYNNIESNFWKVFKMTEIDFGGSDYHKDLHLGAELDEIGADVVYLESLLNKYGLKLWAVVDDPEHYAFKEIKTLPPIYEEEEIGEYLIKIYRNYDPFNKADEGLRFFCTLFLQNMLDNKNVLRDLTECNPVETFISFSSKDRDRCKLNKLQKKIFFFLSGIELDKSDKWPIDYRSLIDFLEQQAKSHPENEFLSSMLPDYHNGKKSLNDIIDQIAPLTQKELLTAYYKKNLELTHGNVSAASRRIVIKRQTLVDKLDEYGIEKKK